MVAGIKLDGPENRAGQKRLRVEVIKDKETWASRKNMNLTGRTRLIRYLNSTQETSETVQYNTAHE